MNESGLGDVRRMYLNDSTFRTMVDVIRSVLREAQMTPTEVRAAAVLACVMYEQENPSRPLFIPIEPRP